MKPPGHWCSEASIWQLVECCDYSADLRSWQELARDSRTGVLDLGCGIGRVARDLARAGTHSLGIDLDEGVVADFNRLSPDPGTFAVPGDACEPEPASGPFDRIFAPQQLLQTVGGRSGREALLAASAGRLAPGGIAAFAFSEGLPTESVEPELLPDLREIDSWIYSSRPVRLEATPGSVTVHRLRQRVSPLGDLAEYRDSTKLDRINRATAAAEFSEAGLKVEDWIEVPATELHVGSVIAVARPD